MSTLIFQSYRTHDVPHWITRCLESVQDWATTKGYDYRFIDDELFSYAPDWYREKVENNVQLVSDLSRLILARQFLQEGWQQVVWVDADILVFDPDDFRLKPAGDISFCKETWVDTDRQGRIIHQKKVNNSVTVFRKNSAFLHFYIEACLQMVRSSRKNPAPETVGTTFLTGLKKVYPLALIENVGIISPAMAYGLLSHQTDFSNKFRQWHGHPIRAANLCGSKEGRSFNGMKLDEQAIEKVAARLIQQQGLL